MARYIHCEKCNKEMADTASKYNELYESIEGIALKDMFCDGGCGVKEATPINKGDKCFAAVLLPNKFHPNYERQKPDSWASGYMLPIVTKKWN